ncbi:translation initiation factor eIF3 subunit g [Hypoxylon texense]
MESSPLIKAHDHAKAASVATHTSDTTVAVNEHTRAAGEFANAARNTSSVEALRTLKLLEEHHRRLSELLQLPNSPPTSQNPSENDSQASEKDESSPDGASTMPSTKSDPTGMSSEKNNQPMPTLTKQPRYPTRDLGASIASNLASARGIRSKYRSQPLSPSVSNTEAPGNMETASRRSGPRTKMQNMLDNSDKPHGIASPERERAARQDSQEGLSSGDRDETRANSTSDEGFSRFYSAFGSIINRISAPLAFAGLPLINEDQAEEPPAPAPESSAQRRNRTRVSASATAEPDLKKIYSRAALRAVSRDGQSANDSFYVVPTSGHTASYASILTFADKEKRRMEASVAQGGAGAAGILLQDHDDDDFVDAKETQVPRSPMLQRLASKGIRSDKELTNVVEELYLENKSLKDMLDKLSRRLHAFESMSQNSGMRLAESIRLMRPGSPLASAVASPPVGGGGGGSGSGSGSGSNNNKQLTDETLARKNKELEDQIQVMTKQMDEMERSYNKAKQNLVRYRDKWEQLKAGAKARRAGGSSSGGGGSGSGAAASAVQGGSEMGADDGMMRSPSLI